MAVPVSNETAPKTRAQVNGPKTQDCQAFQCSCTQKAATRKLPMASPTFFGVRNAEGKENKTSAAADATDNAEKKMAWAPIEEDEGAMTE